MAASTDLRLARKLALLRELSKNPHKHWDLREIKRPVMPSSALRELIRGMEKQGFVAVESGVPKARNPSPLGAKITIKGIEELDRLLRARDGE